MTLDSVISEEDLINSLEENQVPFGIAIKYVRDFLWKDKRPYLPGLLESPKTIDEMTVGTAYTGIVDDTLMTYNDRKFYECMDEVDVNKFLYDKASKAFQTSNIKKFEEHEKLFKEAVAKELAQRILINDHVNLISLGVGGGNEVIDILNKLQETHGEYKGIMFFSDTKKVTIYGIDAFPKMLKKSLKTDLKKFDYHPIVADMKHLPFKEFDGILTINTNTKGNFTRSERENLDSLIADRMCKDTTLYESVYYPPKDNRNKWMTANDYSWFSNWVMHVTAGFRQATNSGYTIDQQEVELFVPKEKIKSLGVKPMTMKEFVKNPHFLFFIYNNHTNNVESYVSPFRNGSFEFEPIFRSHRFTEEELKKSAEKANLEIELLDDREEGMYVVKLTK